LEIWKDVVGYEGFFKVSNHGRVKSIDRVSMSGKKIAGRVLKTRINKDCYEYVSLNNDSKCATKSVHRLVAIAFVPNHENKPQVNHIDCCKTNNTASNLEWVTGKENIHHASINGLMRCGEKCTISKLNKLQVREIKELYATGKVTLEKIASKYHVSNSSIWNVVNNKTWREVS